MQIFKKQFFLSVYFLINWVSIFTNNTLLILFQLGFVCLL